jgi:hypothetical protein
MSRAENYHQPRFLMLSLLTIERLLQGKQNPVCYDSINSALGRNWSQAMAAPKPVSRIAIAEANSPSQSIRCG